MLIGHRLPDFSSWRTCARLCTRGVPAHQNGALVRKARCDVNKDIKHVVKKTQD